MIGAGLDESVEGAARSLQGRFVNLFDPELKVQRSIKLSPGARIFLLDLDALKLEQPRLLASGCRALLTRRDDGASAWIVEGVGNSPAIMLISTAKPPRSIQLDQQPLDASSYDAAEGLLYLRFPNEARPRNLVVAF